MRILDNFLFNISTYLFVHRKYRRNFILYDEFHANFFH